MAVFVRSKQINYPLNERVRAWLCGGYDHNTGNYSSGSEYECISDSFSSYLLCGFLEDIDDQNPKTENKDKEEEKGSENDVNESEECMEAIGHVISSIQIDVYQRDLWMSVRKIAEKELLSNPYALPRSVMVELRNLGYNAGLCKTKWVGCGTLVAGNYEYIDVIRTENGLDQRYFVGLNFRGEFVIANPTQDYNRILQTLPEIFVGKSKDLKQMIKLLCHCMKISLKSRDLHLPPWRKSQYIQAKWFSSYKRTTNQCSSNVAGHQPAPIQCRSIGFILNY